jgi:formiminotetrahydrofolate cyclodeaminase
MTERDERALATLPYTELLERMASRDPAPGGGAGAALAGAMGASLVAMFARVSAASPKAAPHEKLLRAVADGADEARERLLRLADEDGRAYGKVLEAQRMPRDDEAQKASRAQALETAIREATETPLRIMEQVVEVIGYAKNAVETGIPSAMPDGATGSEICRAALKSAAMLVKANLPFVKDEAYVKLARTRMDEMAYMGTRVATNVESTVSELVR